VNVQLTPQHLGEIVDHMLATKRSGDNEKRRATRTRVGVSVPIYPLGSAAPASQVKVILQDISHLGVGLLQAFSMPLESRFLIRLPRERNEELILMCVVKNCRELADSIFSIGGEFECSVKENMINNVQKSWTEDLQKIQDSILGNTAPSQN
jgi:PilZ domain